MENRIVTRKYTVSWSKIVRSQELMILQHWHRLMCLRSRLIWNLLCRMFTRRCLWDQLLWKQDWAKGKVTQFPHSLF